MTLIAGPLESALYGIYGALPPTAVKQLKIAHRNVNKLLNLIDQLLDLSRLENGHIAIKKESFDLIALLKQVYSAFESLAEIKKINFQLSVSQKYLNISLDKEKTERIFNNLISNAFKFSEEGDSITIELHGPQGYSENKNQYIIIEVKDAGKGIAPESLPYIFQRFFYNPSHSRHSGTGIGLSIVKEYTESQGGAITVESVPEQGTNFRIKLPYIRTAASVESNLTETISGRDSSIKNKKKTRKISEESELPQKILYPEIKILIVDDNADMRTYIRDNLKDYYLIEEAGNGREALKKAQKQNPTIIISDIMMPEMDGYQLLKAIRSEQRTADIVFIILTVRGYEGIDDNAIFEADDFLSKPFNPKELLSRLQNEISV